MNWKRAVSFLFVVATFLTATLAVAAHHGSGSYDRSNAVTLTGVITKVELVNPHSFIYIDVKDSQGRTENWALECSPPHLLTNQGWKKDSLKMGTELTAIGFRIRAATSLDGPLYADHLKTTRVLQIGEVRLAGKTWEFGMGPNFTAAR